MLYKPLWYSVTFLVLGFVYFSIGPVYYNVDNYYLMVLYLISYVVMGGVGYFLGVYFSLRVKITKRKRFFKIDFWVVALFSLISNLIYNYVVAGVGIIPTNILKFVLIVMKADFLSLANLYYEAKNNNAENGNIVVSVIYATLGWGRYMFLPYVIWCWSCFNVMKKIISILIIILPLLTGFSIGLNKPVFDFSIVFFIFSVVAYFINKKGCNYQESKRVIKLIKVSLVLVISAVVMFGFSMNNRGVSYDYIEFNSPRGDIKVSDSVPENVFSISLVMLGHYMYQGYYGFSLSMAKEFDSTYGVGHSPFLSRQFERITGIDVSSLTYQKKIDKDWPDGLRWHSAFAQFANDVHFIGVGFFMFFIFFIMAVTWVFSYKYEMNEFLFFMPVHGVLIIFLPANNQVFGFPDSMSLSLIILLMIILRVVSFRNDTV